MDLLAGVDLSNDIEVSQIPPIHLHNYWDFIKNGLCDLKSQFDLDWIPEDIYAALKAQGADLFLIKNRDRQLGFFVAYPIIAQFSGTKLYFIWVFWTIEAKTRRIGEYAVENRSRVLDLLKKRAKDLGCAEIRFASPRRGFEKWGFDLYMSEYRMKIEQNS